MSSTSSSRGFTYLGGEGEQMKLIAYFHCVNLDDVTANITEMDITTSNSEEPDDSA